MIIIGDIHGCYKTLLALLQKCPKEEQIVFCGDLVDRGPRSREVIEFAIENKIPTVKGNHEDLMIDFLCGNNRYAQDAWINNGGIETLKSYGSSLETKNIPDRHIEWIKNLPTYLEFGDLLISHTGHAKDKNINEFDALWRRDYSFPTDGKFRVFGHSPNRIPVIKRVYANIDTGAAYSGYNTLTALQWPSKRIIQQINIE